MKLTDFALIFIAIFLPVVIVVYVNTAFVVKAEKQEMYYKNMMNSAISDSVSSMKQIENEDQEIDYGYSGIVDKKVSINATTAITTFYNSLANNFNIKGNDISLENLKMYIPVIAVMDYDGIYIHSAEQDESGAISFVTKPKIYYTYSYVIEKDADLLYNRETKYSMKPLSEIDDLKSLQKGGKLLDNYIYEVTFTMDDYIFLNIYEMKDGKAGEVVLSKNFYISDTTNNYVLVYGNNIISRDKRTLTKEIVSELSSKRREVIAGIGMREISYAVNKHNIYAKQSGINYTFRFSVESDAAWYETMDGIGMIAIMQGISLGNRYLNYKAYSASDLILTKKYYVSMGMKLEDKNLYYLERNLYHSSKDCPAYKEYINSTTKKLVPNYYTSKAEAATHGFYPCPICKP